MFGLFDNHQNVPTRSFLLRAIGNHPLRFISIFLADTLQAVFLLMIPFAMRDVVNTIEAHDAAISALSLQDAVMPDLTWFIAVVILAGLSARLSGLVLVYYAPLIRVKPRMNLVNTLQSHSVNYFQSSHSGALGNKINDACNGMANGIWIFIFDIWPMMTKLFFSVVLLYFAHASLAHTLLIWAAVYFVVMVWIALAQAKAMERLSNQRSRITGQVVDLATNIQAVKSHAGEEYENDRLLNIMEDEKKAHFTFQYIREGGGWFHTIMSTVILIVLVWQLVDLFDQGLMSMGDLTFVFSVILIVTEQARGLSWSMMNFLEFFGQMRDGVKTIMKPRHLKDVAEPVTFKAQNADIRFEAVSFSYKDQNKDPSLNTDETEPLDNQDAQKKIFDNLDLYIPAGQKLGLIGPSGAGKSSLVSLLMRFYDIQQGRILIDNYDIASIKQTALRQKIAVIPQDTSLFHRSLMDNIRYGDQNASDDDVIEAAKRAYAHEFIDALPEGYNTMVGERGVRLSGGQRQRIAIARAILKDAPILVLDEATSALDSESEQKIQQALNDIMVGKTVIAIAHRLSTIKSLDRLIVMDDGKVVQDGAHKELLQNRESLYAKLWSMQTGEFLKA